MVFSGYRIMHISPCLVDPDKVWAVVELDEEIHEAFPYINSLLKSCIYDHPGMILVLKKGGKIIILYPRKVTLARAASENDVQATMEWLKNLTRDVFAKKDQIKPDYTRGVELEALDILPLLPGMNCKVCDEPNCRDFAIKLLGREKPIVRCAPLFTSEYKEKRQLLLELLRAAGYAVPGIRE